MRSPKLMAGVVSAAAAVALATMFAAPASAAVVSDVAAQMSCFDAQTALTNAQHALAVAQAGDRSDDNGAVNGSADFTPDAADTAVTGAQATVNTDQGFVNALCGTSTAPGPVGNPFPHPHPWPTPVPTPTPGPVGFPLLNCTQLANRGLSNIPTSSPWYRTALDANSDGIACETSTTTFKVINGQKCHLVNGQWVPVTTVTAPAPCPCPTSTPAPVTVVAPAPAPVYVSAPAPVTVPGPVVQGPATYVPGPIVSVPNTSAGINTGDGSTVDDPITISIDLGNILVTTPLPTLPTLPKV